MTLNDYEDSPPGYSAAPTLDGMQAAVWSRPMWAADGADFVLAHRLYEPLTALLLYLHELKRRNAAGETGSGEAGDMIDKALKETERACDVMERILRGLRRQPEAGSARAAPVVSGPIDPEPRGRPPRPQTHTVQARGMRSLTPREREVLDLITTGASNKEGGSRLGISMRTFEVHRSHIMAKLGARNAADLVRIALSDKASRDE